ncbi:MAG: MBL fold metallo-hydrolase, partial [Alphaproteobacteria bacterium]|nr:MBL fold metallo-hydrolase [Alphaproteobacteria bacterium]
HPDHAFGMAQLKRANAVVMMHPAAKAWLLGEGPAVLGFMEVPMGQGWLAGIEITKPNRLIRKPMSFDLGGRTVQAIPLVGGHTAGDVIVFDDKTRTLFAGDLVFHQRAPTVPHADVPVWLDHLRTLRGMDWQRLVPGHGPLVTDPAAFGPMEDYLEFLDARAREAVQGGEMLAETLAEPLPDQFRHLHSVDDEYSRSMRDLFRKHETNVLDAAVTVN